MQRLLLICRHAEANEPYPLQPDFERELTKNGIHQAHLTGQWLRDNHKKVDVILSSPASRASATARILAGRLYFDEENISYNTDLYNARGSVLADIISGLPDTVKKILLVGHNPGITQFCRSLTEVHLAYLEPAQVVAISADLEKWEAVQYTLGKIQNHNIQDLRL